MYQICKFIENIFKFINIKIKIFWWKLKYGKRIKIGKGVRFRKRFSLNIGFNGYVEIGNGVFFNDDCSINCHEKIIIGDSCQFGHKVILLDHDHKFGINGVEKNQFNSKEILIEKDVWIGANCVILKGIKIGDKSVISAGSTVTKDIPKNTVFIQKRKNEFVSICREKD